jgi:hypothetical protein
MKKVLHLVILFLVVLFLTSCQKKLIWIKLNVSLPANINVKESDDLPQDFKNLLQFQKSVTGDTTFFYKIKLIRIDYSPQQEYQINIGHTTENKIRTFGGIIPGDNFLILKQDMEAALPELHAGKILSDKSNSTINNVDYNTYDAVYSPGYTGNLTPNQFTDPTALKNYLASVLKNKGKSEFSILYPVAPASPSATTTSNDSAPVNTSVRETSAPVAQSPEPVIKTPAHHAPEVSSPDKVLQQYFDDLSNPKVKYSAKDGLVGQCGNYFNSDNTKVVMVGDNNTIVADLPAREFLETLRTTNQYYLFVTGTKGNSGKYSEIKVRPN